ncbi:S49 family peptidase [Glaciecola sp. MH2013]|uniref:SDH family Clp fold serine proteinase n=1 Tax=Glaciecola sp. MH2013 TaxID=2785524 RepID=UPI00189F4917|nr:S49 family peptidase [Glaciecola sp. MH2013]MBF7074302.1 S49 family peptidase [Glaciecola sp. MH2013]
MPSWNQVLEELTDSKRVDALDYIRRKYMNKLSAHRDRNVIAYYSGWLQKPGLAKSSINDDDKNGFMATIHELDRTKGLDLLLHTPGGDMAATESIIDYLHRMFDGNIETFIPQIAMSGGTMIACSTKNIIMGKQSNIGPIDPQFGGIPAHGVVKEFEEAIEAIKSDPGSIPIWQAIIGKYHPTFVGECKNAIKMADEMVERSLISIMFNGCDDATEKARNIVSFLNEHEDSKTHARHINIDEAKQCGLRIEDLEDDETLQDLVLTVHHCFMHTFANANAIKIIENQNGIAVVMNQPQ